MYRISALAHFPLSAEPGAVAASHAKGVRPGGIRASLLVVVDKRVSSAFADGEVEQAGLSSLASVSRPSPTTGDAAIPVSV